MIVLAIDCSAELCAACVYDSAGDRELGRAVLDIGKGHAEHLIGVVESALAQAGKTFADLDRIVVSVGPGSFTGIRVAVAAARGFALALRIPAVGVSVLEAWAAEARAVMGGGAVLAARGFGLHDAASSVQAALYDALGREVYAPSIMTPGEAGEMAERHAAALAGTAAERIAETSPGLRTAGQAGSADIIVYARLGAAKDPAEAPARPLYLREPDAKPQAGFVLPRREGP